MPKKKVNKSKNMSPKNKSSNNSNSRFGNTPNQNNPSKKNSQEVKKPNIDQKVTPNQNQEQVSNSTLKEEAMQMKISELEGKVKVLEMENKDWQSKTLRFAAEMENSKKQSHLEAQQNSKSAKKSLVKPLMDFLNNLYLVTSFVKDIKDESVAKSMSTIKIAFDKVIKDLDSQGVNVIVPSIGDDFDAHTMQALQTTNDENKVTNIVSLGVKIDGQLISPAIVML